MGLGRGLCALFCKAQSTLIYLSQALGYVFSGNPNAMLLTGMWPRSTVATEQTRFWTLLPPDYM